MKLNICIWFAQIVLALMMFAAGLHHLDVLPLPEGGYPWMAVTPAWLPTIIGLCEIAGSLGLILPAALKILPVLTNLAAACIIGLALMAAGVHIGVGDMSPAPNFVIAAIAGFVLWGRFSARPIQKTAT